MKRAPSVLITSALLCVLSVSFVKAAEEGARPVLASSLEGTIQLALERNPEVQAAQQTWRMRQAEITPARAWPNPTLSYIDEKDPTGVAGVDPMQRRHWNVQQMIPFPGKLSTDARMKHHEAMIAEAAYRTKALEVRRDAQLRFYQLYRADQKSELLEQAVQIMKAALVSAQSRLASGQNSTVDVFMAQAELRKIENMFFAEQQERKLVQIELNTLLNQPTETVWDETTPPPLQNLPGTLGELKSLALEQNPTYFSTLHEISHSRAMLRRSRLEFAPDFGVMYEYQTANDTGPAGRQLGVSLSIPLWFTRPWGQVKSAQAHSRQADAMAEMVRNMVKKMVHMEYVESETHLTLARNYEAGILPATQGSLNAVRQQYASGQMDFLKLLDAFRTWLNANVEYQDEVYHAAEHWSELERWVGTELE